MIVVDICNARARLSQLLREAVAGHDVVISRNGKPVARLTRLGTTQRKLRFGLLKGKIKVLADFDDPLPADILKQRANL